MPQPPRSPTTIPGNPRNQGLAIGTSKDGFPDDVSYSGAAGSPLVNAGGTYRDNVQGSPFTDAPTGAAPDPKPFK